MFPEGYFQEVQVIANVLSADLENDPDILAMIGASAALTISKIPFMGPTGACRLGRVNGEFVINPTHKQIAEGDLIEELREKVGVEKEIPLVENDEQLEAKITSQISDKLYELKQIPDKQQRNDAGKELFEQVKAEYCPDKDSSEVQKDTDAVYDKAMVKRILGKIEGQVIKKLLLSGKRSDGRGYDDIRSIACEVGILPRTHGSALFTRGETQSLVSVTLGTIRDAQIIDGLLEEYAQNFTLHYNFPPFSVGEVRPVRGVGRREIGHGALAEKALEAVRPPDDEFAYTVRIVSDITESNGSSSMASVCGGTLALMDAGVPIIKPVAGISIGMISDGNGRHELLTDIAGEEDHFGEMDFKVAGTVDGITAIQLDIKAEGLAHDIMIEALKKAKTARIKILETMAQAIDKPRVELSVYAPKLVSIEIDPEFIGKVIGPGGKMIKGIQEQTGTTIEVEEDGTIYISCLGGDGHLRAREIIESITQPPEVGRIYEQAKVVSVKDFGVFVEIVPGVEGLCHISELSEGYVKNVEDVCKMGDLISVKLILIDDQGRLKLSRKAALIETKKKQKPEEK